MAPIIPNFVIESLLSFDTLQTIVQFIKGSFPHTASKGQLPVVAELQEEALRQLLHRLLQGGEKLPVGKIAGRAAFRAFS